jgi:hypothetical protein
MRPGEYQPIRYRSVRPLITTERVVGVVLLVALLAGLLTGGAWLLRRHWVSWSIDRGLAMLAEVREDQYPDQLAAWEDETGPRWRTRRDEMIRRLMQGDLADRRVQFLLERVSGMNFADRADDWRRWHDNHERLRAGRTPEVAGVRPVVLESLWQSPIGLTAWFSTILPFDGQIYVASLGTMLEEAADPWDGVVRVDGVSGASELLFVPPDRAPRDILGLSAADDGLFVACRNGFVYLIAPDGTLRWRALAGPQIVSVPLTLDVNGDGALDVIVVTADGKLVGIDGRSGRTPWVLTVPGGAPTRRDRAPLVQAGLAAGDYLAAPGPEVAVSTDAGDAYVVTTRPFRVAWHQRVGTGSAAAPLTFSGAPDGKAPVFIGDSRGDIWALQRTGADITPLVLRAVAVRRAEGLVAALRSIENVSARTHWLLACPSTNDPLAGGSVCAVNESGLRWRHAPGGTIWATPAVADINLDHQSEIIVASIELPDERTATGLVSVLTRDGHTLRQLRLPAAVEAAPVVADVNGDGRLELLVADQAGVLHSYAVGRFGRVEWGVAGGDSHNTNNATNAFSWGQVSADRQWNWRPRW